jgi:hypothetical protein
MILLIVLHHHSTLSLEKNADWSVVVSCQVLVGPSKQQEEEDYLQVVATMERNRKNMCVIIYPPNKTILLGFRTLDGPNKFRDCYKHVSISRHQSYNGSMSRHQSY